MIATTTPEATEHPDVTKTASPKRRRQPPTDQPETAGQREMVEARLAAEQLQRDADKAMQHAEKILVREVRRGLSMSAASRMFKAAGMDYSNSAVRWVMNRNPPKV